VGDLVAAARHENGSSLRRRNGIEERLGVVGDAVTDGSEVPHVDRDRNDRNRPFTGVVAGVGEVR
jgi:hypothetical protein